MSTYSRLTLPRRFLAASASRVGRPSCAAGSERADLTPEDRARVAAVTSPRHQLQRPSRSNACQAVLRRHRAHLDTNVFSHASANLPFEARTGLQARQRALSQNVGVLAVLDAGVGRARAALQRALLPALPPEGRARAPALATGDADRRPAAAPVRPAAHRRGPAPRLAATSRRLRIPEPTYGGQLQTLAVPGLAAEGRIAVVRSRPMTSTLGGGETARSRSRLDDQRPRLRPDGSRRR